MVKNTLNKDENYLSVNIPNPFSELTVIKYAINSQGHNAEIRVTSMLGQQVKTYKLQSSKGIIVLDGAEMQAGMYFYSLIVDGSVYESKTMVVQH